MGQKITSPDIEHGNDCNRCTGAPFFRWPAGETPEFLYAKFWLVNNCGFSHHPAPNDQIFRLTQSNINHCIWVLVGSTWFVEFQSDTIIPPLSQLKLLDHDGWSFFTSRSIRCPLESWRFVNMQAACVLMYAGSSGFGFVWWNEKLLEIVSQFGLDPGPSLFYEAYKVGPVVTVHRFADQEQRTNIKFKASSF